ncbi:MAG: hypothetical protein IPG38_17525 [Chitinophagaceae bacterium]|nr:hypothetical protein [Chitinophagaceae bacterium]
MRKGEEKMLYCLGGLMQLGNDIFDVYKDHQGGVSTLITTTTNMEDLRFYFSALLQTGTEAAYRSGYAKRHVKRFLGILSIGIFSRCFVCLDQMARNQKRTNGVFELNAYSRKELVCDMDTIGNKLRSLRYHIKISK